MADLGRTLDAFLNASTGLFRDAFGIAAQYLRDFVVSIGYAQRGYLYGLTLSNNATDANNDIDIATGGAWDAGTDALLRLTSSLTKRLDASWAVGSGNGGIDTGSKANSTTYHVWLIRRSDTGIVDALFSTSASSPTMPANYDQKRRIGSVITNGSGNILGFAQRGGDTFLLSSAVAVLSGATPPTSSTARSVISPLGVICQALVSGISVSSSGQKIYYLADAIGARYMPIVSDTGKPDERAGAFFTDTSSQIMHNSSSATNHTVSLNSVGWIDRRGQDG